MVFERLTDRSREVLVCGRLAAQQCGHRSIEAPHLVVGLLRHRETNGCQALNRAGLHYVDALTAVQGMYERTAVQPDAPPVLTAQAKRLLDDAMNEAAGAGGKFVETAHLALACSRPQAPPSIKPLVAGREQAIAVAAQAALERSAWLEAEVRARRPPGPPSRSLAARLDALERANIVRTRRAQLKRDLKTGRVAIHALLLAPPDFLETAKVFDVLLAVPSFGRVKVNKILTRCRISPSKTVGGLSERQRDALVELLRPS